jgi:exopolysaccharide biosynthesis protein
LPARPDHDLLQAGPLLVQNGRSTFSGNIDPEGFSQTAHQHDEDINYKPHPRAAIGISDQYVWTVTVDGRNSFDAGMFLDELAEVFLMLGAGEALNLDGGSSSTHISAGGLVNTPRTDAGSSDNGYGVQNAIILSH